MKNNKYKDTIFSLQGKNALVIGGLGQIGIYSVEILLAAGATVEVLDIEKEPDDKNIKNLRNLHNKNDLIFSNIDITNEKQVNKKIIETSKNFGSIDILINHAHFKGDPQLLKPHSDFFSSFENYPFDVWKKTIDVNLNGLF